MKPRILFCIAATTLFAAALGVRLAAQEQPQEKDKLSRYRVTDLGTLGGSFSVATDINNKGFVAGTSSALSNIFALHAFLWRKGLMRDLGTLGGPNSTGFSQGSSVNASGEVVGFSDTSDLDPFDENFCLDELGFTCLPFIWRNGFMTPLPTLGGNNGRASDINNRGQVVGQVENATLDSTCEGFSQVFQLEPVLWDKDEVQQLPTFPGDPDGMAVAINEKGQAVGASGDCNFSFHALLWQNGSAIDLGSLGGTMVAASEINNRGQVVGSSSLLGNTTTHAFLWENGVMKDIDTVPGDLFSYGSAINNKGEVVGTFAPPQSISSRAFLWQKGVMTDLNTLIPAGSPLLLLDAFSINSRGQIVGDALQVSTGDFHAYLATPQQGKPDSEGASSAALGVATGKPNVLLSESVRQILRERFTKGKLGGRLTKRR
jgi:probable HAF family extracellular repeat protein